MENEATVPTCDSPTQSLSSNSSISVSPKSTSDSDYTTCGSPRKRARESSESEGSHSQYYSDCITSSTSRSDSESPIPINEIPSKTSEWTELHLSQMNITIDGSTPSPFGVFTCGYTEFLKNKDIRPLSEVIEGLYGSKNLEKEALYNCCLKACIDILSVDVESIFDVHKESLQDFVTKLEKPFRQTDFGKWLELYAVGKSEEMKDYLYLSDMCKRIHDRMKDFCEQLLYMIECGQKELTEGMFQELFTLFVRIFDLKIRGFTNFQSSSLVVTVGKKKIFSIPDAVIYKTAKKTEFDGKILAVVEVKKKYSNTEDKISERNSRNTEKRATLVDHLDPNLKGQHVGEMLAVLPRSIFKLNGIYGIIVQGTEVTISSLTVGEQYYESLKEGSLHKMSSVVKYSRPYNFLKKSERESLIRTFVDMKALIDNL